MDKAEVGDVEEVFHDARAFGVHAVGAAKDGADAGLAGDGERGKLGVGLAEGNPDYAIALDDVVGLRASLGRRGEGGVGGNVDALAGRRVFPGVIGTDEAVGGLGVGGGVDWGRVDRGEMDSSEGKLCATVDAEVAPAVEALLGAPEDEVGGEEATGEEVAGLDLAGLDFVGEGDGEPFLLEDGVG